MNKNNKLVSLIIPTLNEEDKIGDLLDSILKQDYKPIEVIIVDGGSTDNTLKIINEYMARIKSERIAGIHINVIDERAYPGPLGTGHAFNIGISNSHGKYVFILASDFVLIERDFISKVVKALNNYPCIAVKVIPIIDTFLEEQLAMDDYDKEYKSNVHLYAAFDRDILLKVNFDESLSVGEDYDLLFRLPIKPILIDAYIGRHFPHTIKEYICLLYTSPSPRDRG